jgi:hypothetical protein
MPVAVTIPHNFSATPAFVLQSKGYVRIYWAQQDATPDADGFATHTTLTFEHTSTPGGKQYRAILSEAQAQFPGGKHQEIMISAHRPDRVLLSSKLAPRYSAKKFAAFVHSILGGNLPA